MRSNSNRVRRIALAGSVLLALTAGAGSLGPAAAEDASARFEVWRFDAPAKAVRPLVAPALARVASAPFASTGAPALTPRPLTRQDGTGLRTVCVRLCDGYHFPVGPLRSRADLPVHQAACDAACPGAPVRLFMTPRSAGIERAVAEDRMPYRRLATAFAYRRGVSEGCSCSGPTRIAARLPILQDPTLRPGDAYVTGVEAKVFAGDRELVRTEAAFQDLGRSQAMPRDARRRLHAMLEGNRRARAEIVGAPVTAVAAFAPVRRIDRPGSFQVAQGPARGFSVVDGSGTNKSVRVIVVSPFQVGR